VREINGTCLSTVQVCLLWENECKGADATQCKKYRKMENKHSCSIYDFECDLTEVPDQSCITHCKSMHSIYNNLTTLRDTYIRVQNWTIPFFDHLLVLQDDVDHARSFIHLGAAYFDTLLKEKMHQENLNVSIDLHYDSTVDLSNKSAELPLVWNSIQKTADKLFPAVLRDICKSYGIPQVLATQLDVVLLQLEASNGGVLKVFADGEDLESASIFVQVYSNEGNEAEIKQKPDQEVASNSGEGRPSLRRGELEHLMEQMETQMGGQFEEGDAFEVQLDDGTADEAELASFLKSD